LSGDTILPEGFWQRWDVSAAKRFFKKKMRAEHRRLPFSSSVDKNAAYPEALQREEERGAPPLTVSVNAPRARGHAVRSKAAVERPGVTAVFLQLDHDGLGLHLASSTSRARPRHTAPATSCRRAAPVPRLLRAAPGRDYPCRAFFCLIALTRYLIFALSLFTWYRV
jgi:hypothetical protein